MACALILMDGIMSNCKISVGSIIFVDRRIASQGNNVMGVVIAKNNDIVTIFWSNCEKGPINWSSEDRLSTVTNKLTIWQLENTIAFSNDESSHVALAHWSIL